MNELVAKFEKEFSLVSCLFGTLVKDAWFVDNDASCHMAGLRDVFTSIKEE